MSTVLRINFRLKQNSAPWQSKWGGEVVDLTQMNAKRFIGAIMPPNNLDEFFEQGYENAEEFLNSEYLKKFLTNVNTNGS